MNKKNNFLDSVVHISQRYQKSVRIDADTSSPEMLDGFIIQRSGVAALNTIASHVQKTGQRAFTLTGPYGSGKSSLSLFLYFLASGDVKAREKIEKSPYFSSEDESIRSVFCSSKHWTVKAVTGRKASLESDIISWIDGDSSKSFRENLEELVSSSKKRYPNGLIIIADELGKYLEGGQSDNCYALQEFAEYLNRGDGNIVFVGVLHQSFAAYSEGLSKEEQNEWSKVQGRYVDVPLLSAPDEILQMIGEAVVCDPSDIPSHAEKPVSKIVEFLSKRHRIDEATFTATLMSCWPLNPTVALVLGPISRKSFFQNTRSVFNFLNSREPNAFQAFLEEQKIGAKTYSLSNFWDYLSVNFEQAIIATGKDSHKWNLAQDCVRRTEALGDNAVEVAKTVAILDLFGNGSNLEATRPVVEAACTGIAKKEIEEILDLLVSKKILIERKFKSAFSLFEGSDFDFEKALEELQNSDLQLDSEIFAQASLSPVIARRHYSLTGALRWFGREVVLGSSLRHHLNRVAGQTAGSLILCIPDTEDFSKESLEEIANAYFEEHPEEFVVFGWSEDGEKIKKLAVELQQIDQISRDPALEGDRPARNEITLRKDFLTAQLKDILNKSFYSSVWISRELGEKKVQSAREINTLLSDVCDKRFESCPIFLNEQINREKLSTNIVQARKRLMLAMAQHSTEERLGITKYPPEMMLYLCLFEKDGIHVKQNGEYRFFTDASKQDRLSKFWNLTYEFFKSQDKFRLSDLYEFWARKPIGLKEGLRPVLALAFYLANKDNVYLYVNGAFRPDLTEIVVDYWTIDPNIIEFRYQKHAETKREGLEKFAKLLRDDFGESVEEEPLAVARAIVKLVLSCPAWSLKTTRISDEAQKFRRAVMTASDPIALLFEELNNVFETDSTDEIVGRLGSSLKELTSVAPNMLSEIRNYLYESLDSDGDLDELRARANVVLPLAGRLQLQAFVGRVGTLTAQDSTVEGIIGLAAAKPKNLWTDRDIQLAINKISEWGLSFRHLEAFASLQNLPSNRRAFSLVVGGKKGARKKIVDVPSHASPQIEHLSRSMEDVLAGVPQDKAVAAIIELAMKYIDEE